MSNEPNTKYGMPGDHIRMVNVSSCTSNIISWPAGELPLPVVQAPPYEPFTLTCDYCRGVLAVSEKQCPGCGARRVG